MLRSSELFLLNYISIARTFTLAKNERLKSRKIIEQLFAESEHFSVFPYRILFNFKKNGLAPLQAGFGVSSRQFKKATDRNRIKRLGRETYRLQKNELRETLADASVSLSVFFIYTSRDLPVYKQLFEKMQLILQRFISLTNEKVAKGL